MTLILWLALSLTFYWVTLLEHIFFTTTSVFINWVLISTFSELGLFCFLPDLQAWMFVSTEKDGLNPSLLAIDWELTENGATCDSLTLGYGGLDIEIVL